MKSPMCVEVSVSGSALCANQFLPDIGEQQRARHGVAKRIIVSRGLRAGAIIPYRVLDSNPGCRHVPLS
jgi:hypothetical protein